MDQFDYIKIQIFTTANTTASKMKNPKETWKPYLLTCDNVLCSSIRKKIIYQYKKMKNLIEKVEKQQTAH